MHKILIFVSWLIFVHPHLFFLLIMTWNLSRFLPSSFNAQRRLTTILKFRFPILLCSFCNNIICHWRIPYLASATKVQRKSGIVLFSVPSDMLNHQVFQSCWDCPCLFTLPPKYLCWVLLVYRKFSQEDDQDCCSTY